VERRPIATGMSVVQAQHEFVISVGQSLEEHDRVVGG
jgi:hypothetical protein